MNIKTIRHQLHSAIVAALSDYAGINPADIHRFRTSRWTAERATHMVLSTHQTGADLIDGRIVMVMQVLSRYNDKASEEAAEDALDDIESILLPALLLQQDTAHWVTLDISDGSRASVAYDGATYRLGQHLVRIGT